MMWAIIGITINTRIEPGPCLQEQIIYLAMIQSRIAKDVFNWDFLLSKMKLMVWRELQAEFKGRFMWATVWILCWVFSVCVILSYT